MNRAVVKNINNVIYILSNDVSYYEGFSNVRCLYNKKA